MPIWSAEIKELGKLYESFKGQLPELEKELGQLILSDDPNVILLYSRRCLEVIITDLCECELKRERGSEPLKGIIDKLNKEKKIPAHIASSMYGLNELSTYGTHPKDFDPEQAKPVLNNLAIIIKWYLKYKQVVDQPKDQRKKSEITEPVEPTAGTKKSKKGLIYLISGLTLVAVIVILALFIFDIIGGGRQIKELEKSIAVLPFKNESSDQENTYFINGIMESILDNLSRIEDLRVVSRNSVEKYRTDPKSTPVVAEEMDVSYVLEGSGQKVGNRLLLTVQLIVGDDDRHIWSKQYDREIERVEDLIDIQKEIAELVVKEIEVIITPSEKELIEIVPTINLTAYDFYQRGTEEEVKGNADRAEDLYRSALEYDSHYADAYVGLARIYWMKHYWETIFEENFLDSVLILANIALSIDDRLSDAYTVRGEYYSQIGESEKAIEDFDKAIFYNPNNGRAYLSGGSLYYRQSDLLKSIQYSQKALSLIRGEQLPEMLENLAWAFLPTGFIEISRYHYTEAFKLTKDTMRYYDRLRICEFVNENFSEALNYLEKAYAFDSTNPNLHSVLGEYYMMSGDYVQSLLHFRKWLERTNAMSQNAVFGMHRVGWAYWMNGLKKEGEVYFKKQIDYCDRILELGHVIGTFWRNYYDLAATYAFIGDKEKAFENLRYLMKYQTPDRWGLTYLNNDPLFNNIREEPEFRLVVREIEAKYQAEHERVRKWLEEQGMLYLQHKPVVLTTFPRSD